MHRKGTVHPCPYPYLMFWDCSEGKAPGSPGRLGRSEGGVWFEAGCCLLSRHRLQRLGRRRAARKCTLCACCCHFLGISWLRLSFPFFICAPLFLPFPPLPPNCLTCCPPSPSPWHGLHAPCWDSSPPIPEPFTGRGSRPPGHRVELEAAGRRRQGRGRGRREGTPGPPGIVWGWMVGSLLQELCGRFA